MGAGQRRNEFEKGRDYEMRRKEGNKKVVRQNEGRNGASRKRVMDVRDKELRRKKENCEKVAHIIDFREDV